jgi:hypothetical protein
MPEVTQGCQALFFTVIDTGAIGLVIGEETCKQLGLAIIEEKAATLAGYPQYRGMANREICQGGGNLPKRWL